MQRAPLSPLVSDCGIGGLSGPAIVEREIESAEGAGGIGRVPRRWLLAVSAFTAVEIIGRPIESEELHEQKETDRP
jgi:hypothetical protein